MEEIMKTVGLVLGPIGIFGGIALLLYGGAIVEAWRKARQTKSEAALKRAMVERGMSADDIVRVLQTGLPTREEPCQAAIGQSMVEGGYKADDIAKVVQAWPKLPPGVQVTVMAMVERGRTAVDLAKVIDCCRTGAELPTNGKQPTSVHEIADPIR